MVAREGPSSKCPIWSCPSASKWLSHGTSLLGPARAQGWVYVVTHSICSLAICRIWTCLQDWGPKKRTEERERMCTMWLTFKKLSQGSGQPHASALSWGTGVRVALHPNLKEAWLLTYFTEASSACGGAEDWSRVGKLSLGIPSCGERLSQLSNEYSQEHSLGISYCSWRPSLCWAFKRHCKYTSEHMKPCPLVDSRFWWGGGSITKGVVFWI